MTTVIIFFTIASLINVMLNTAKSIFTIKGTKLSASIINAITFGFYTVIVKQIADFDLVTSIIVITITNLIGVWLTITLIEKFKKDTLWKISITTKTKEIGETIINELNEYNIAFRVYTIQKKTGDTVGMDIFSETQTHSILIKKMLDNYGVKYHVTETLNKL